MAFDFFRDAAETEQNTTRAPIHSDSSDNVDVFEIEKADAKVLKEAPKAEPKLESKLEPKRESVQIEEKVESQKSSEPELKKQPDSPMSKNELKKLAARLGDQTYEIPAEAKFKHLVDGKETEFTLQQLLNDQAGRTAWDKKFSALGAEKKQHKEELDLVNKYVNDFAELSKKDKVAGLAHLAKSVGLDPLQYKRQLRAELLQTYGPYAQMSKQEQDNFDQKEELEHYRQLQTLNTEQNRQAQAQRERQATFGRTMNSHGIDNDRLSFLADELQNNWKLDVTPENVVELHTAMIRLDRVDAALGSVDEKFLNDTDKVAELESLLRGNPKMTDDQLVKKANQLFADQTEKALKELEKSVSKRDKPSKKNDALQHKLRQNSFDFFDQ